LNDVIVAVVDESHIAEYVVIPIAIGGVADQSALYVIAVGVYLFIRANGRSSDPLFNNLVLLLYSSEYETSLMGLLG
jgi:hypothetical protein